MIGIMICFDQIFFDWITNFFNPVEIALTDFLFGG